MKFPFRLILVALPLCALLGSLTVVPSGCERIDEQVSPDGVEWPELEHFDHVLREAEVHAEANRPLEILKTRAEFLEAGWAVNPASVPENVRNFDRVRPLLGDLVSRLNGLAVSNSDGAVVNNLVLSMRPVVSELIEASGLTADR